MIATVLGLTPLARALAQAATVLGVHSSSPHVHSVPPDSATSFPGVGPQKEWVVTTDPVFRVGDRLLPDGPVEIFQTVIEITGDGNEPELDIRTGSLAERLLFVLYCNKQVCLGESHVPPRSTATDTTAPLRGPGATPRSPKAVRDSLFRAESLYLAMRPANLAAARAIITTVDRFGRSSLLTQVRAHTLLLTYGDSTRNRHLVRQEAARLIALVHRMTPRELQVPNYGGDALVSAYSDLMALAKTTTPDSMSALARRFQGDIHQAGWAEFLTMAGRPDLSTASVDTLVAFLVVLGGGG